MESAFDPVYVFLTLFSLAGVAAAAGHARALKKNNPNALEAGVSWGLYTLFSPALIPLLLAYKTVAFFSTLDLRPRLRFLDSGRDNASTGPYRSLSEHTCDSCGHVSQ